MHDEYSAASEFYDVLATQSWPALRAAVRPILESIEKCPDGVVVDIGAGSGLCTLELARTFPFTPVVAVEPSPSMRALLTSKLASDDDLAQRVRVWACTAQEFTFPPSVMAVTVMDMVGHLPPKSRRDLFARIAAALCPQGLLLIHLQDPPKPARIPCTKYVEIQLGDHVYEGWAEAIPTGEDTMEWLMHYRVLSADRVLREEEARFVWWTVGPKQLMIEAESVGLSVREPGSNLFALQRSA